MSIQNSYMYIADLDTAIEHSIGIEKLKNRTVLITGATGTIGSFVADTLFRYNQISNAQIKVCVVGRHPEKLKCRFENWNDSNLIALPYDIQSNITFDRQVDYIIHAAGNAHPAAFNEDPVGTIIGNINGTYGLLKYGLAHDCTRLLYVSSGEVYGQGELSLNDFSEDYAGYVDGFSPRSCYPQSKRAAENLCFSFTCQYGMETVIARPCHTYGPEITPSDNRASVQFIKNALNREDIVMKSAGSQLRSYNYVADCTSGLLTILINGKSGEAYNVANPAVRITIAQLAEIIAKSAGKKVVYANPTDIDIANRSPIAKQVLSSKKLENLGWRGAFSAEVGIRHTIDILQGK